MEKIEIKTVEQKSILTKEILNSYKNPEKPVKRYSKEFLLSLKYSKLSEISVLNSEEISAKLTETLNFRSKKDMSLPKSFPEIIKNLSKLSLKEFSPLNSEIEISTDIKNFQDSFYNNWTEEVNQGCTIVKMKRLKNLSHINSNTDSKDSLQSSFIHSLHSTIDSDFISVPKRYWKKNLDKDSRHFMVLSWNLLAPFYAKEEKFYLTQVQDLNWEARKRRILDEIIYYSPDFICLQELEEKDFVNYFFQELVKFGYQGHFQKKKRDFSADGCAIFYQSARFSILNVQAFAYHERIPTHTPEYLRKRLNKFSNIALVCVFQSRFSKSLRVRVVTTHLHWDPGYADTKLLQASILIEWLESNDTSLPTVIAGDFNSKPGEPVIDYLIRGKVFPPKVVFNSETAEAEELQVPRSISPFFFDVSESGVEEARKYMNMFAIQRQGVKLASAYNGRDLPFTNKTPDFEGVIDHILYSSGTLSVRDVLCDVCPPSKPPIDLNASSASTLVESSLDLADDCIISPDSADANIELEAKSYLSTLPSLPSQHFPSDHISLCAWLKWKTVPILSNLARPGHNSPRRSALGTSKLSQSVPSEALWKHTSKPRNTPRKSSLCSNSMDNSLIEFQMTESGAFVEQKTLKSGRQLKK